MTYSQLLLDLCLCVIGAHCSPRPKSSGTASAKQCKYLGSPVAQWKMKALTLTVFVCVWLREKARERWALYKHVCVSTYLCLCMYLYLCVVWQYSARSCVCTEGSSHLCVCIRAHMSLYVSVPVFHKCIWVSVDRSQQHIPASVCVKTQIPFFFFYFSVPSRAGTLTGGRKPLSLWCGSRGIQGTTLITVREKALRLT